MSNDYYNNLVNTLVFGEVALNTDLEAKFDEVKVGFDSLPDLDYFELLPSATDLENIETALAALSAGSGVVVSATDTTAGFVQGKILNVGGNSFPVNNSGGNETITISLSPTYAAKTANYAVTTSDLLNNTVFTNTGAADEVILTLPAGAAGSVVSAVVTVAQHLRITADGTEKIRFLGQQSAAGGYIKSNVIGNTILAEWDGTEWVVRDLSGTWFFDGASTGIGVLPDRSGNSGKFLKTNGTSESWDAPLPDQSGNSGKILTTNGSAASWTERYPRAGSFDIEASGSVTAGKVAVLNSDGTASEVSTTGDGLDPVLFESGAIEYIASCYDSTNNKTVVCFQDEGDSDKGKAVVGTISVGTISFGATGEFETGTTQYIDCCYDSSNGKVVVAYRDQDDTGKGKAAVGTVSGENITFGTPVQFEAGGTKHISCCFDVSNGKVVILYMDDDDSDKGKAIVGTVSGDSISFGTAAELCASPTSNTKCCYDPDYGRVIAAYRYYILPTYYLYLSVGTVSGTDITFQGAESVVTNADWFDLSYDTYNDKVVLVYDTTSIYARVVTVVSGSGLSLGSAVSVASGDYFSCCNDTTTGDFYLFYKAASNGYLYGAKGTVSGENITFGTPFVLDSGGITAEATACAYDASASSVVVFYEQSGGKSVVYDFSTTAYEWCGIFSESKSDGETVTVKTVGAVDANQSGLTIGEKYYVDVDGELVASETIYGQIGTALSATSLLITKGGYE